MDSYFQREHGLPNELARMIFEFATIRDELLGVRLQPYNPPIVRPYNLIFFRNWQFILDRTDRDGTYTVLDRHGRVIRMFVAI